MKFRKQKYLFFICLLSIVSLLFSCKDSPQAPAISNIYIEETDPNLVRHNGYLFYKEALFSGQVFSMHTPKDTASLTPYWQGKEEGYAYQKYPNGVLKEKRFYSKGWKQGKHKGWWESGKLRFVAHFKDDLYEGNLKEWYQSGLLFRDFNYKNGQEEGKQRAWWENRKIRQNYEIVNQRRYGLLGIKNCKTVME